MSSTFFPLAALQAWYDGDGDAATTITLYLLDATVAAGDIVDSFDNVSDLPGLLPTTGSYSASTGIDAGAWPLHYDGDVGVMELSLPDGGSWASTDTYTLTFRWLAIAMTGGTLLSVVDFGAAQTLTNAPLQLYATQSTDLPNSYPAYRWRKYPSEPIAVFGTAG